ncbi:SDR family NAD(P)-dependent oxidoreductase, partial [Mycobacterium tuberculosis]|nr:SDR family NAD(P)-dependent oxidoreductase [Mycobacterium tuberculosis]
IVNVSSMLGSQTPHAHPSSGIYDFQTPASPAPKAAVNSWTLSLAYELRNTPIKGNTVHPGYVKTDMNGGNGEIEIAE